MSKKHVDEQKLLIENFNKWISEEKCGEKEIEETSGRYTEAEPIKEKEEIDEGLLAAATLASITAYSTVKTLVSIVMKILSLYNKAIRTNDQIQKDESIPKEIKDQSQSATDQLKNLAADGAKAAAAKLVGVTLKSQSKQTNQEPADEPRSPTGLTPDKIDRYRDLMKDRDS